MAGWLKSHVDDRLAVVDHVGCERVAVLRLGVPTDVLFAASHPHRTTAPVLADASARYRLADDYPAGWPDEEIDQRIETVRKGGPITSPEAVAPSLRIM
jgi:hypothetical protein